MKIAAQMYTVRDYCKTEADIFESLKKIKQMGYNYFQLSGFGAYDPENLKRFIDELGLKVFVTHVPLKKLIDEPEAVAKEHKILGAEYVGLGYYKSASFDDYKKLVEDLKKSVKVFEANGLKFVYHNHHHEFIRMQGTTPLDYILDNIPQAGLLADLYWVHYSGHSPEYILNKYKSRIEIVHLKDMTMSPEANATFAEIFEGNMDYESIINKCLQNGVKWAAIEQDSCVGNPFDSLKLSLENIKKRNFSQLVF